VILPYYSAAAECREWDPRAPEVSRRLIELILSQAFSLTIEHIGSTAVPGCAGKGVIDLLVLYGAGQLEVAKDALRLLGFQSQSGRAPFPEDRPMRVGAIEHDGAIYRIHVHVVASHSPEAGELIGFRDRLRSSPALLAEYVATKRRILAEGITDSLDYSIAKGDFIANEIARSV
jgi:GrpB-like predicted nucleotidyltransferase (UPF0157 family)